jgi:hypothetical protein
MGSTILARFSFARAAPTLNPRLRTMPASSVGGPKTSARTGRRGFSSSDLKRRLRERGAVGAPLSSIGAPSEGGLRSLPLNSLRPSDLVPLMLWSRCVRLVTSSNGDAKDAGPSTLSPSKLRPDCRDRLFWLACERLIRANQSVGRDDLCEGGRVAGSAAEIPSLDSCASGPSGCIDGAVDVIKDIFMSWPNDVG